MDQIISQWIPNQFPSFYKGEDNQLFIAFLKAYYEYHQSQGIINKARQLLDYQDVDKTPDEFLIYFQNEFLKNLPQTMMANKRLLIKHILDLYRTKGTPRGYELLFRVLFNEDIQLYFPGDHLFAPSDNTWKQQTYIETTSSPYLSQLPGQEIFSSSTLARALVEEIHSVTVNNKIVNVITISHIEGVFNYGDFILCENIPGMQINAGAPQVSGSLSSISINDGGAEFNVGDVVQIIGSGFGGLGRVSSVTAQNGKVIFHLENGGDGFSLNAQVQVAGGGGSGATFAVGSIIDPKTYILNTDVISDFYETQLDISSEGFQLGLQNTTIGFTPGEIVSGVGYGRALDFTYLNNILLANNDVLSNTAQGISNLNVVMVDNPSYVNLTGTPGMLQNSNLNPGLILLATPSGSQILLNSTYPYYEYDASANVEFANSTVLIVDNASGYFLPTSNLTGNTSGATAQVVSTARLTNWGFPNTPANTNLDSPIEDVLQTVTILAGKIASLTNENPGQGYSSNPSVTITEPLIYQLQLPDGYGGFLGGDANVSANALNASGITTSVQIIQSGFGYLPDEALELRSNNMFAIAGTAVIDQQGITEGYWTSTKSMPSTDQFIQDSDYYQRFSYEIGAPLMMNAYSTFVTNIVHPVGYKMFGKFWIQDQQKVSSNIISDTLEITST